METPQHDVTGSILATKLYVPPAGAERIHQRRLLERLDESLQPGRPLILVSAPAGYGKTTLLSDPTLFSAAGANALLPIYRWSFTKILGSMPVPFVIALILFEGTVGVLILSQGKAVQLGLLGATLFCLFLVPVGIEEVTSPALAVSFLILMRKDFPQPALRLPWMKKSLA